MVAKVGVSLVSQKFLFQEIGLIRGYQSYCFSLSLAARVRQRLSLSLTSRFGASKRGVKENVVLSDTDLEQNISEVL
ncbi:hypothetical protein KM043_012955 [Ampulex compressa]|nr:hypothetical protein KM043_012955 [Ampulex compressa]